MSTSPMLDEYELTIDDHSDGFDMIEVAADEAARATYLLDDEAYEDLVLDTSFLHLPEDVTQLTSDPDTLAVVSVAIEDLS